MSEIFYDARQIDYPILDSDALRGSSMALLFVDLDHFEQINESLGYEVGNSVLREVAERFRRCVRASDVVARGDAPSGEISLCRPGGDEFTVLLTRLRDPQDASRVASRSVVSPAPNRSDLLMRGPLARWHRSPTGWIRYQRNASFCS